MLEHAMFMLAITCFLTLVACIVASIVAAAMEYPEEEPQKTGGKIGSCAPSSYAVTSSWSSKKVL
jgi:hypothetical protein